MIIEHPTYHPIRNNDPPLNKYPPARLRDFLVVNNVPPQTFESGILPVNNVPPLPRGAGGWPEHVTSSRRRRENFEILEVLDVILQGEFYFFAREARQKNLNII